MTARTVVGVALCVAGLISMVPGVLLVTLGRRLAEGPSYQAELWRSYLSHPSARSWAADTVRGR